MTKDELIKALEHVKGDRRIIISVADDSKPYPFLRAFGRKIDEVVVHHQDAMIVMTGEFNNDTSTS